MTKSRKIIMGLLAFSPIPFILMYFIFIFGMISRVTNNLGPGSSVANLPDMKYIIVLGALFMIFAITALVAYIVDVINSEKLKKDQNSKIIWLLVVILTGFIGRIVYFIVEIYPRPRLDSSTNRD